MIALYNELNPLVTKQKNSADNSAVGRQLGNPMTCQVVFNMELRAKFDLFSRNSQVLKTNT
ncbi:hypothetical protein NQ317_002402 [Molorchus minor]|uniref:Uncharacterized protein n=1 Tax=Molorchus minor TaxID=1323400 RepID=A0ABQ9JJW8_9CUCU|nr:hypothetical protein NQ317_002402 [Molorchus minor]